MASLPSKSKLQAAWEDLKRIHKAHLDQYGVEIPPAGRYEEHQHALWLAVLHHFRGEDVDKNFMSEVAARDMPHLSPDQQVRHLKRKGWEIRGSKPGLHKLDPRMPSSEFLTAERRKAARLAAGSFEDVKAAFGNRCATCGAKEGGAIRATGMSRSCCSADIKTPIRRGMTSATSFPNASSATEPIAAIMFSMTRGASAPSLESGR